MLALELAESVSHDSVNIRFLFIMALGFSPKTSSVVIQYLVKTTGDRFFIPAYPDPHVNSGDLASCQGLSPKGVQRVA